MDEKVISTDALLRKLQHVAQVRAIITMLSIFPILLIAVAVFGNEPTGAVVVVFFGSQFVVSWILTRFYCKRAVTCPHCGSSLWHCGTGNFKPRRMRIRRDARGCLECHAVLW